QQKKSSISSKYQLVQKIKKAGLVLPVTLFSQNLADYAPVHPLAEKEICILKDKTGKSELEQVEDNRISSAAMTDLDIKSRVDNAQWYKELMIKNKLALIREMVVMTSLELEQQRQALLRSKRVALLVAQDRAAKVNNTFNGILDGLYQQAAEGF
ncbi:MAG: hypothetical protein GY729_06500, partial [Desulfobacteraceae bacterium]|nr:hypothetical protein [Desulfobacteraceae bacterium]